MSSSLGTSGLDRKTKIGIIASVVVVVVLLVMGCTIGVLDCRKGFRRRKQRTLQKRDSELVMLESQMRRDSTVTQTQTQRRRLEHGLWDHLKNPQNSDGGAEAKDACQSVDVEKDLSNRVEGMTGMQQQKTP
ncbi:hypothetical protein DM02DRAFT_653833 [Periconia macrospinosa]|uniref:Uncharacterized protein n=1 Tax=Periconia macrospinosa TaxID=97972 RepID=A0A2V1DVY9_9PLEO|nr:hypothetical protein DM02DRAFT_653833 [Periconia macrospinosa]